MSKPLQYQTTMADRKRQRLLTSFMTGASQASAQKESDSSTSKTLLRKSPETVNKPEAVDQTAAKPSESKACREFRDDCLKNHPWLEYDGHKMTCKTCVAEGKDNPFTSGCTNLRHSTLVRHMQTNQHKASLEAVSLRSTMNKQTMSVISKKNTAVTSTLRSVYWLAKEQLPTLKHRSLLNLQRLQGCSFPDELEVGSASYTSAQSASEMQDAIANVLKDDVNNKLVASPYISILLDESCDISVTKKLLIYAKTISSDFDIETHFLDNLQISDGTAKTIYQSVKNALQERNISLNKVLAVGSDGASVMTGRKNGFVALLKKQDSPYVIGIHCVAHRLALCSSQATDKVPYLKQYQQILSDIFYHFKRSALRRTKINAIQAILEDPTLQYKELHSVRWFSMYSALETVYRTWGSLATYFETEMEQANDSTAKGFFKKMTSFVFIAVTHLLMDIIPKVTQLSLFFQKDDIDLAMIRPSVDSVVQQLTWLKTNDGRFTLEFMSVAAAGDMKEFKGIKTLDTPVLRQQFKKVKEAFLSNLIQEIEKRFPAVATDLVSNMAVFSLRGLSLLSDDDMKSYGQCQMNALVKHYALEDHPHFIDPEQTVLEWEKCKALILQQRYPCHTVQSTWKLLTANHPDTFPNLSKLVSVALLAPLQTATVERGFSIQNEIKVSARNRLSAPRLNTLMQIAHGPEIEAFDFDSALKKWKESKRRKLFSAPN